MDSQPKIVALEAVAAECELISQRATATDVRAHATALGKQLLEIANDLRRPELIASAQRIATGRLLVARQRGVIARMESQGHSTIQARALLAVLEDALMLHQQRRDLSRRKPQ